MPIVTKREAARRDLVEHFIYLAENAGLGVADEFLRSAEASFTELARQPQMGAPLTFKHLDLANLRKWRIKGFDNHLIFYEPRRDGVSVVRVLHAARDWWGVLGFLD
jgi:toxin ParE1/3/4